MRTVSGVSAADRPPALHAWVIPVAGDGPRAAVGWDGLVSTLRSLAAERGVSVAQLAIAWVLSRGSDIIPLVGARRRDRLAEALGALAIEFTADDLATIEAAVPEGAVAGERYAAAQFAQLDSER